MVIVAQTESEADFDKWFEYASEYLVFYKAWGMQLRPAVSTQKFILQECNKKVRPHVANYFQVDVAVLWT